MTHNDLRALFSAYRRTRQDPAANVRRDALADLRLGIAIYRMEHGDLQAGDGYLRDTWGMEAVEAPSW